MYEGNGKYITEQYHILDTFVSCIVSIDVNK